MDAMLAKLRSEGLSSSLIGERMTAVFKREVTRGAVIGRANRLKLPTVSKPSLHQKRAAGRRRKKARAGIPAQTAKGMPRLPRYEIPPDDPSDIPTKTFMELEWNDGCCRWRIDRPFKGEPYGFCGKEVLVGLPWCKQHAARACANWIEIKPKFVTEPEKELERT